MIYYFKRNLWPHIMLYLKVQVLPGEPGDVEKELDAHPPEFPDLLEAYQINDVSGIMWDRSTNGVFRWDDVGIPATEEEFEAVKNQFIKYQKDHNASSNSN